jgi:hypothetical protein
MLKRNWIKSIALAASILISVLLLTACNYGGLEMTKSNAALLKEATANSKAANSYHLVAGITNTKGDTRRLSADVDAGNGRIKGETTEGDQTTGYVQVDNNLFISDDGGASFAKDEGNSSSEDDPVSLVGELERGLDGFKPEEADKAGDALRDGSPLFEMVEGVVTKHIIASAKDIPSLANLYMSAQTTGPDTIELWVAVGQKPTIRRFALGSDSAKEATITLEWSKLDEPVAIETPKNIQISNADLIKKAATNMQDADSYETSAVITMGSETYKFDGQLDIANDLTKIDIDESGRLYKIIGISGEVYLSSDLGWTYTQDESGAALLLSLGSYTRIWDYFTPSQIDFNGRPMSSGDPRTEKIDGVLTRHITVGSSPLAAQLSGPARGVISGKLELWISTGSKPYVYRMAIDSTFEGQELKATLNWRRFNEKFDIAAPPASKLPTSKPTVVARDETPPRMSLDDFKALYDDPAKRPIIIDVRAKSQYEEGHIAGAISIPESELDARVAELPKDKLVIAYCQ